VQDVNGEYPLKVTQGVPQGSPCSPLLFNILLDPIVRYLMEACPHVLFELFADDTTLMGKGNKSLHNAMANVDYFFPLVGLKVNRKKSALLLLDPDRPPPLPRSWEDCPIVDRFKYLGIWVGKDVDIDAIYEDALTKLELRSSTHSPKSASFHERILIWNIYTIPLVSYIMRFFPPSHNVVSRITRAAKRLLDPHRLLPIPLLLGEPLSHPYLSAPTPYHPIPYSLLQSRKDAFLCQTTPPPHTYPPPSAYARKLSKFLGNSHCSTNLNAIRRCDGRLPHTLQLIIFNGLFIWRRVHHFWEDFPHHCRLCDTPYGDDWNHMLVSCPSVCQLTRLLHDHDPDLEADLSTDLRSALLSSRPLSPEQMLNRLVLLHTLWILRHLSSISMSYPGTGISLYWSQRTKAVRQGLLRQLRRASTPSPT
jgi:hypothetical protein